MCWCGICEGIDVCVGVEVYVCVGVIFSVSDMVSMSVCCVSVLMVRCMSDRKLDGRELGRYG